jgi:DNA-binding transcriptional MerR regulator
VRITGLRREQLYMWQRRYGFPAPLRDPFGDRVYPPDQVGRLKLIKQLLSEGWRAGAVVPLAETALQSMLGLTVADATPLPAEIDTAGAAARAASHRRIAEPSVEAARRTGAAQVSRADAHPAQRSGA